jgi:hypothetical protein
VDEPSSRLTRYRTFLHHLLSRTCWLRPLEWHSSLDWKLRNAKTSRGSTHQRTPITKRCDAPLIQFQKCRSGTYWRWRSPQPNSWRVLGAVKRCYRSLTSTSAHPSADSSRRQYQNTLDHDFIKAQILTHSSGGTLATPPKGTWVSPSSETSPRCTETVSSPGEGCGPSPIRQRM